MGDTTSLVPGFPIRTSSDPRSVDSSPRHIAASHVLHRLPVPRHPPCALTHLHTNIQKKLHDKNPDTNQSLCQMLATTIHKSNTTPHHQSRATTNRPHHRRATPPGGTGLLSQSPIVCLAVLTGSNPVPAHRLLCTKPAPLQRPGSSRLTPSQ